jgi:hypothetical protein
MIGAGELLYSDDSVVVALLWASLREMSSTLAIGQVGCTPTIAGIHSRDSIVCLMLAFRFARCGPRLCSRSREEDELGLSVLSSLAIVAVQKLTGSLTIAGLQNKSNRSR